MENILLEVGGISIIGISSFLVTKYLALTPLSRDYDSKTSQRLIIIIPLFIYILSRIYFGISFYISNKVNTYISKFYSKFNIFYFTISLNLL